MATIDPMTPDRSSRDGLAGSGRPGSFRRGPRRVLAALGVAGALTVGLLAGCTSGTSGQAAGGPAPAHPGQPTSSAAAVSSSSSAPAPSSSSASVPARPVRLTVSPGKHEQASPLTPITVAARGGKLTHVKVKSDDGAIVSGVYSSDHASWHSTEVLGYGHTYAVTASGLDATGESKSHVRSHVHTLVPDNQTLPYFQTIYGSALENNATYGIGMIPVVQFDEDITNRTAAEKALHVTTTPHVDGSWTWIDSNTLHWRPRHFYKPGTKVTIDAKVYGKNLGTKDYTLYGQEDRSISFTIGASHISVANDKTHRVKVYFAGKLVRTMKTSMGQHSGETVKGKYINFWTPQGTYTVIGHENPAKMCSATYGLPKNAPGGYPCEKIPWSTKITTDGIYLHELDTTIWAQGHTDVSHGCLNLDHQNAKWFYDHSLVGDVVKIIMPGGPKLKLWEGGDWTVPWKQWIANSALS